MDFAILPSGSATGSTQPSLCSAHGRITPEWPPRPPITTTSTSFGERVTGSGWRFSHSFGRTGTSHRYLVVHILVDVFLNHLLGIAGFFQHDSMIRGQADDQRARHVRIVGTESRTAVSDGIQKVMTVQTQEINDVMERLCLQHIDSRCLRIIMILINHIPLGQLRLLCEAICEFSLGSDAVQIAHARYRTEYVHHHQINRTADRCICRPSRTLAALFSGNSDFLGDRSGYQYQISARMGGGD